MTDQPHPLTPYEGWIALATGHLINAVDTALDELDRDRDFIPEDHDDVNSPTDDREECRREAVRRFVEEVNGYQEGDEFQYSEGHYTTLRTVALALIELRMATDRSNDLILADLRPMLDEDVDEF